jgi:hypothetical protein
MGCGCGKKQAKNVPTNRALPSRATIVGRPPMLVQNNNVTTQLNMQQQADPTAPIKAVRSNSPYADKERIQRLRMEAIERAKGKRIF